MKPRKGVAEAPEYHRFGSRSRGTPRWSAHQVPGIAKKEALGETKSLESIEAGRRMAELRRTNAADGTGQVPARVAGTAQVADDRRPPESGLPPPPGPRSDPGRWLSSSFTKTA